MGPAPFRAEVGEPREQAEVRRDRGGQRVGGGFGGGDTWGTRLSREVLLFPGQPAARAQHRRAGRDQRREELPERRRQRLPAVLRHDQRGRLPGARSERVSARGGEREYHRPMRGAGRAVRARVWGIAGEPFVWRRASLAHILRARPNRPAIVAWRVPGAVPADWAWHGE